MTCRLFTRSTGSKRFYAEFLTYAGEQEISPVWAADYDGAVQTAKDECLGKPMKFVRVEERWDAFKQYGFVLPRHVIEAPPGSVGVGDKVYWRGPTGDAPPVVVVVEDIMLGSRRLGVASWRRVREGSEILLDNGCVAYGWQLEPLPAMTVVVDNA